MSRPIQASTASEKQIGAILDFAKHLKTKLPVLQFESSDLLLADIGQHITSIKNFVQKSPPNLPSKTGKSLQKVGRELWNLCIRLKRDPGRRSQVDCRVRLLALHVIELGHSTRNPKKEYEQADIFYFLGLSATLARICLRDDDLESGRAALQKAAELVDRLKAIHPKDGKSTRSRQGIAIEADYLTLRMALKENRLDVAEHIFSKLEDLQSQIDTSSAENMSDTLLNIGTSLVANNDFTMAVKWFRRAFGIINAQPLEQFSVEGLDARLATIQGLIQSLIRMRTYEATTEANELISYIEGEIGDKPIVLHWRLEMLQQAQGEAADPDSYASTLRRLIQAPGATDETLRFVLYHIQQLGAKSQRLANSLLTELLLQKALPSSKQEWVNKLIVHKVWFSTMEENLREDNAPHKLFELLTNVLEKLDEPLSADVAGAAQSLIWKKVDSTIVNKQFEISDKWCFVALHDIFSNCGDSNKAKFGRKRILCALGLNHPDEARLVYASLPQAAQNDILTRYLMFKVALKIWDTELGIECIQYLSEATETGRSQDMLYACIREAQQAGDKLCTIAALKAVAEKWDPVRSSASCLTSVLRCGIRLITMLDDEAGQDETNSSETFAEDTCRLFEIGEYIEQKRVLELTSEAADRAQKSEMDQKGNTIFTVPELNWFRKNAYNIGVVKCTSSLWELRHKVRIFSSCLTFNDSYPKDIPVQDFQDLAVMSMRCHFVIAAALVSLARTEDIVEEKYQRYLEMRHHIASFQDYLESHVGTAPEVVVQDLRQKLATLFTFDFEGAVALKNWESLSEIVRKSELCNDASACKAMGDCLLRSEAPSQVLFTTLRLIINQIHTAAPLTSNYLCKYIRCLFQGILPLDPSLALQLVDQAIRIAQDACDVGAPLPHVEMEWLVARTFNHAVDCYARAEEELCGAWALKAIELAGWMDDGGELRGVLEGKFAKLNFEAK